MSVFIVGGTGFVGVNLANRLRGRGDDVTVLGHTQGRPRGLDPAVAVVVGDATAGGAWQERLAGHETVVNLAGASIFTRWTEQAKQQIRRSRKDEAVHLFYRAVQPGRWFCAVARQVDNESGFLVTAYPTDAIKQGETIWHR